MSPSVKKDRKKFGLKKKKSSKGGSVDLTMSLSNASKPSAPDSDSTSPLSVTCSLLSHIPNFLVALLRSRIVQPFRVPLCVCRRQ